MSIGMQIMYKLHLKMIYIEIMVPSVCTSHDVTAIITTILPNMPMHCQCESIEEETPTCFAVMACYFDSLFCARCIQGFCIQYTASTCRMSSCSIDQQQTRGKIYNITSFLSFPLSSFPQVQMPWKPIMHWQCRSGEIFILHYSVIVPVHT